MARQTPIPLPYPYPYPPIPTPIPLYAIGQESCFWLPRAEVFEMRLFGGGRTIKKGFGGFCLINFFSGAPRPTPGTPAGPLHRPRPRSQAERGRNGSKVARNGSKWAVGPWKLLLCKFCFVCAPPKSPPIDDANEYGSGSGVVPNTYTSVHHGPGRVQTPHPRYPKPPFLAHGVQRSSFGTTTSSVNASARWS